MGGIPRKSGKNSCYTVAANCHIYTEAPSSAFEGVPKLGATRPFDTEVPDELESWQSCRLLLHWLAPSRLGPLCAHGGTQPCGTAGHRGCGEIQGRVRSWR